MAEQPLSSIRILITDDFKDWRRQVLLLFQARPEWQVTAEAADGPEAIQKAEELRPDLIVLDIGLPKLSGIEAARRIRQLCPESKIIFLSQNNDVDVVRAALGTGALGYVHKTDAQSELLPAVDAVLRGKQFVSSNLRGFALTDTSGKGLPHCHEVQFYSDDAVFLDTFVRFIAVALKGGDAAIAVVAEPHRNSLVLRLKALGVDVDAATQKGTYIQLDAADTLSTFMVNDMPDAARFFETFSNSIQSASKAAKARYPRVAICGEGVALLWAEGKREAAIRIEQLCNDLAKIHKGDILCAYPFSLHIQEDEDAFKTICAEHSAVYSQ